MTRKLEETFNLPPLEDMLNDVEEDPIESESTELMSIDELSDKMSEVDKIDNALKPITDLEALDSDMDAYAKTAIETFNELVLFGKNVEDRHAAAIFDSAAKMMTNAITAKTAKLDRKLKVIQMQMQKKRIDIEERKLEHKIESASKEPGDELTGTGMVIDRTTLLSEVMAQVRNNSTGDK